VALDATMMPAAAAVVAAGGRRPQRRRSRALGLVRLLVLVMGIAVAVAAGLAMFPDGAPEDRSAPAAARESHETGRHRQPAAGVGDSQSDDPSDDEEDGGEP
jgi:hypothetical protein